MYSVEYINCKICGSDTPKFIGIRGNREYSGADILGTSKEHMVTNIVKCKKCGFVYTNPLLVSKIDAYADPDKYSSSYSVGAEELFGFSLDLIERHIDKGRILDIGCGKGEFLSLAKKRGWETYGLEPSANLAKFASERHGLNIKSDLLEKNGYPDCFFDVVVLNMVLEHVESPKGLISGINRILKKRGALFIEVPNMDSLMLKIATLYFRVRGKEWSPLLSPLHYPYHCYGYNLSSLKYLLTTQGFCIKKALIRDSSLRGFRRDSGGTTFEKFMRNIVTRLANLCGNGDVLILISEKL